jgi:hypothetical protein
VIFIGDVNKLNLSKIQADSTAKIQLDLHEVTGMDKPYGAEGHNTVPSSVHHVVFPENTLEISVPVTVQTVTAPKAKTVHLHGSSFSGLPSGLSHMPSLVEVDMRHVASKGADVNLSHLSNLTKVHLNPESSPAAIKLRGDKVVEMTGAHNLGHIDFTVKEVTKEAVDKARLYTKHVEVLNPLADHSLVLNHELNLSKRGDTTAEKDKVVEAIKHMGIANIKHLKLKATHLSYVMEKLEISNFAGFSTLEKLELVDAIDEYADALIGSSHITKTHLPASIKEFYSKNSVVIKGALASGALGKAFNATHLDLSEATGGASLSAGAGFIPASVHSLHLPENLDLSVAGTRTFVANLSALTHLYVYGTSSVADLQAGNVPASVTHLDVSNSSATAVLPALGAGITHVTLSAAYLAATGGANKFGTFVNFALAGTPANKILLVKGAAGGALTTSAIPNVGTVDLRQVTGATAFSASIDKQFANSNLAHLYLPLAFDVTAVMDILLNHGNGDVTVYVSGEYLASGGSRTMDASYGGTKLDLSAVTGGGLFRIPATVNHLTLSNGIGGISGDGAATANVFDLKALTQLTGLTGLPVTATKFCMNNNAGTAFGLDLSAHVNLTELSLNASKVTHVHLPTTAHHLTHGGLVGDHAGHLNLSGLTGLVKTDEHPNPIRGLDIFSKAGGSIHVISLPRALPAGTHVNLSNARSTIFVRNLHKAEHVTPHATAAHLTKPTHSHGVHDRSNLHLWRAYLEERISAANLGGLAETSLDLAETPFAGDLPTTQAELDVFFAALNSMPAGAAAGQKGYVQNIHVRLADSLNSGTLHLGRTSATAYAVGLKSDLRVSVHKHSGLTVHGSGFVNTAESHTELVKPTVNAGSHVTWTSWINQQTLKGVTHLDLSDLQFANQGQLNIFFEGLGNATDKNKITRIDIGFDDTGTGFNGVGAAVLGHDMANGDIIGLNVNLKIFTHNKAANITGGGNAADEVQNSNINITLATPAITDNAAAWTAWINQQILKGSTHLNLSALEFANQAQLDELFGGLHAATGKINITRIDIKFAAGYDADGFGATTAVLGNGASVLNNDLKVYTITPPAGPITGSAGAGPTAGEINNGEIFATLATPVVAANDATWTAWINQQILQGLKHINLNGHAFANQGQLDAFFLGLHNATNKANITRIDIGFAGGYAGGAVLGNGASVLNNDLKVYTHNVPGGVTVTGSAGASGTAGQINTDETFATLTAPAVTDIAATWTAWINQQILQESKHIDLSLLEFASQAQVNAFFAGLNDATHKHRITRINLGLDGAYATNDLVVGMTSSSTRALGLNLNLQVYVDKSAKPAVTITGAGGADANEVAVPNLHTESAATDFDKLKSQEWHSYILHHLGQGKEILDLKEVTIASDAQATALQTALVALPSHIKDRLRGVVVKLAGGNLTNGSFATNANKLTLDLSSLPKLETLFVDLNQTQDGGDNVGAESGSGITLPASGMLIPLNPHA